MPCTCSRPRRRSRSSRRSTTGWRRKLRKARSPCSSACSTPNRRPGRGAASARFAPTGRDARVRVRSSPPARDENRCDGVERGAQPPLVLGRGHDVGDKVEERGHERGWTWPLGRPVESLRTGWARRGAIRRFVFCFKHLSRLTARAENPRVPGSTPGLGTIKTSNGAGFIDPRRFRL